MPTVCLVTGASGFIGSHLVEFLVRNHEKVYGMGRRFFKLDGIDESQFRFIECDILDREKLQKVISEIRPAMVFHLAAQSLPVLSWKEPELTFRCNVFGTIYLLDAIRSVNINPIIEVFCSSGEYAINRNNDPIDETFPLFPSSPYALTKICQDHLSVLYGKAYGMRIVRVRPFFIIGARKRGDVCSDFARGVVAIENGCSVELAAENLSSIRDFLDVRDAVRAFRLIAMKGSSGEVYNVCSGHGSEIKYIWECFKGLSTATINVRTGLNAFRPLDEPIKIGSNRKLRELGWSPEIKLNDALRDILEYWRAFERRPS